MDRIEETLKVKVASDSATKVHDTLKAVYEALSIKGYNPVNQIVAYIMSGDPTYITSYNNARNLMSKLEPDEILEIIVKEYLKTL